MSSLNIMCAICMDFYKTDSIIVSTIDCGHLFHRSCIDHWLSNAHTCPRCCKHCSKHRLHRVYLDFTERTEADDKLDEQFANEPVWIPIEDLNMDNASENILSRAIKCGKDDEGFDTYVARVYFGEDLLPAGYVPEKKGAYTPWGCHGHFLTERIELLLDCECTWVEDQYGHVPEGAILTGYSETGEGLYTGRALFENKLTLGKVHPSHKVLYAPIESKEVNTQSYEVLVQQKKQEETSTSSSNNE